MRLNRGTLIILALSAIVIVGAYLFTSNQASQTAEASPTPAGRGPLFPELTADEVIGLSVGETESGAFTRLSRESTDAAWVISGPADAETRELDVAAVSTAIENVASLSAESQFEVEDLAEFGLDNPAYTIELDTGTDLNIILIGNANPGETRYYVQHRVVAVGDEAAAEETNLVYLVMSNAVESLTDLINDPPFLPLPTATTTPTATLNPLSEVQQATATAEAQATTTAVFATLEAEATAEVTEEPTEE